MSKAYRKYIKSLPKPLRLKVEALLARIVILDLEGLDSKKMQNFKSIYRVRSGKIRIVFEKKDQMGIPLEVNTRGDIY